MIPSLWERLSIPPPWRLPILGASGAFVGLAAYVALISNAASYLSDSPETCINCHVMTPMYASWRHSSHARVAVCNDCHVPHNSFAHKTLFKMMDGARHSAVFTFRLEPQVLRATPVARRVIQQNCLRCHGEAVHSSTTERDGFGRLCIDCHREVPHGRVDSLSSTPNAAVPPLSSVIPPWLSNQEPKETQRP